MNKNMLLIDNYDSFTYNLVHTLAELGVTTRVVRNDSASAAEVLASNPRALLLSPGPGNPQQAGICLELLAKAPDTLPILGVCLGHQAIGEAFGGTIVRTPLLMHGKVSEIMHEGTGLFATLPQPFLAARYHSLVLDPASVPACLKVTAHTRDGLIMALEHRSRPIYGVQFHPESVATQAGHHVLANFLDAAGIAHHAPPHRQRIS